MSKIALITGISGQDASYLADLLVNKDYEVWVSSREKDRAKLKNLEFLEINNLVNFFKLDIQDYQSVKKAIEKIKPDEIYNLSCQSSVGKSFKYPKETNESIILPTINFLEAIKETKSNARYLNPGSSECYSNATQNNPCNESFIHNPLSPYAIAKTSSAFYVDYMRENEGIYACSAILTNHESPLRPKTFVTRKIVSAAYKISKGDDEKLRLGNIDIKRDWGWAPEYVEALWRIINHDRPENFLVATGFTQSLRDFLKTVFREAGLDWKEHVEIDNKLVRRNEIEEFYADPKKINKELGWKANICGDEIAKKLYKNEVLVMES